MGEGEKAGKGSFENLAVPSTTLFLSVGRPSLLPPYKGLSAFQGQTRLHSRHPLGVGGRYTD